MKTNRFFISILILVLGLGLAACGGSPNEGDPLLAEGERLFNTNCLSCHPSGADQPRVGPYLVGLGANLAASGQDAAAALEESIRNPGAVITTGYQDLMPPAAVLGLSDADIQSLVAYLMALK